MGRCASISREVPRGQFYVYLRIGDIGYLIGGWGVFYAFRYYAMSSLAFYVLPPFGVLCIYGFCTGGAFLVVLHMRRICFFGLRRSHWLPLGLSRSRCVL